MHLGVPVDVQAAESPVPLKPFCAADVRDDVEHGASHSFAIKTFGLRHAKTDTKYKHSWQHTSMLIQVESIRETIQT